MPSFSYAINAFKGIFFAGASLVGLGNESLSYLDVTDGNDYGFLDEHKILSFYGSLAPGGKAVRETIEDISDAIGFQLSNKQLLKMGYTKAQLKEMPKDRKMASATRIRNKFQALLAEGIDVEKYTAHKKYDSFRQELNRLHRVHIKSKQDNAKEERQQKGKEESYN
jgi:hypothetical protein